MPALMMEEVCDLAKAPVWIATIEHKYGTCVFVAKEEATLKKIVLEAYIKCHWLDFCEGPIPEDPDEAIREYFECAGDCESLTIEQGTLYGGGG